MLSFNLMILILFFTKVIADCLVQYPDNTQINITKGEVIRESLQKYIKGRSVSYNTTIPLVQQKAAYKSTNLLLDDTIAAWDISKTVTDLQWTHQLVLLMKQKIQIPKSITLYTILYSQMNGTDDLPSRTSFKSISLPSKFSDLYATNCTSILSIKQPIIVVDCVISAQQIFYVYNTTDQSYTTFNYPVNQLETKGKSLAYYDQIEDRYYFLKLYQTPKEINVKQNVTIIKYEYNVINKTLTSTILFDKSSFTQKEFYIIDDGQIYDSNIFLLIDYVGIVKLSLNSSNVQVWTLFDNFDRFSIFKDINGQLTALVASNYTLYKVQLLTQVQILSKYGIDEATGILKVAHNNQYVIIQAQVGKQKLSYFIWVFDDESRIVDNVFYEIDYRQNTNIPISFNPVTNNLIAFSENQIANIKFNEPIIEFNDQSPNQITISGFSQQDDQITNKICKLTIQIHLLEQEDKNIYIMQELQKSVTVLQKNLNTIPLSNLVIGAKIDYKPHILGAYQNDEVIYYTHHINNTNINMDKNIPQNYSLLHNKVSIIKDGYFLHAFQLSDQNKTFIINLCQYFKQTLNCSQNLYANSSSLQIDHLYFDHNMILVVFNGTYQNAILYIYDDKQSIVNNFTLTFKTYAEIKKIILFNQLVCVLRNLKVEMFNIINNKLSLILEITPQTYDNMSLITQLIDVTSQVDDYYLYVLTDRGLAIMDPGIYDFYQVKLIKFIAKDAFSGDKIAICNKYLVLIQQTSNTVFDLNNPQWGYISKQLLTYDYTLLKFYSVGFNQSTIYFVGRQLFSHSILVYKLDNPQLSTLYTVIQDVSKDSQLAVLSLPDMDSLFYFKENIIATKIYLQPQLCFQNPPNLLAVDFIGFDGHQQQLTINITSQDNKDNLVITGKNKINDLNYTDMAETEIIINDIKEAANGSINIWNLKCRDCPRDLAVINYIDLNKSISEIPNLYSIKHSDQYVFLQQEKNLIIIDNYGNVKFIVPLPINDNQIQCKTVGYDRSSDSQYVVSVCYDDEKSNFFLTSLLSSQPFAMGPFRTYQKVHEASHIRIVGGMLFTLDKSMELVYVFDMQLDKPDQYLFKLLEILDAQSLGIQSQNIIYFDVSQVNKEDKSFLIYLLTELQYLGIIYSADSVIKKIYGFYIPDFVTTPMPSNVQPLAVISIDQKMESGAIISKVLIINQNFNHFEFEVTVNPQIQSNVVASEYICQYIQYGFYQATTKFRVSDDGNQFLAIIYYNPFDETKNTLIVYDRKEAIDNFEGDPLSVKQLGGYRIDSNIDQLLIDFSRNTNNDNQSNMIIAQGSEIKSLIIQKDLKILIKDKQFKDQQITLIASNDFNQSKDITTEIFNKTGKVDNYFLETILGCVVIIVLSGAICYVKKKKIKIWQTDSDENLNLIGS
ncbi:hypothetical protein pb186bvf_009371 [Paramecium bursaria]